MERREQRLAHNEDLNCGPLSLVMISGTLNLWIHPCRRAAVQSAVVVEASGIASSQRVVLSITVNWYEKPEERGRGPTKSKVPKCEIFHRSDFHDFYSIKPFWVGDFRAKI
jgi:hypothetical protein